MIPYNQEHKDLLSLEQTSIKSFVTKENHNNIDWETVESFGEEWSKFAHFSKDEIKNIGEEYFDVVDDQMLNKHSIVLDMGCGTGRWTKYAATRAKFVEAIDPSKAVVSAAKLLHDKDNVRISQAEVSNIPFADNSFDFVFSLGVLHHIPDTKKAMLQTTAKLKSGGHFLVYLYYSLDNKGLLFKILFHLSNLLRRIVCILPTGLKKFVCDCLAILFYLPFVLLSKVSAAILGKKSLNYIPLSWYYNKSWNVIRNDSLDRFGTPLEQRFSKKEITEMMTLCGIVDINFSNNPPYWHAVGRKK